MSTISSISSCYPEITKEDLSVGLRVLNGFEALKIGYNFPQEASVEKFIRAVVLGNDALTGEGATENHIKIAIGLNVLGLVTIGYYSYYEGALARDVLGDVAQIANYCGNLYRLTNLFVDREYNNRTHKTEKNFS